MQRYKIITEYDGTDFFGWQRQASLPTIQEALEKSILPISKEYVSIIGAGRTDTGVHALGQTAHFDLKKKTNPFVIQQCMNSHLKNHKIAVLSVEEVDENFHARFSAIRREYKYIILSRRAKPSIHINKVWWVPIPLCSKSMNEAAQLLTGIHDFSSFRAKGCQSASPIKIINEISVTEIDEFIELRVSAQSFLYHQVRNIVGSLYKVGRLEWSIEKFYEVFVSLNRSKAGITAPPHGLYFVKAHY